MSHRMRALVALLVVIAVTSGITVAQFSPATVYLPLISNDPLPTATPVPTAAPQPTAPPEPTTPPPPPPVTGVCATNAPTPSEGAAAWVTNQTPAQNTNQTVCARLISGGQPQRGIGVTITVNYKSTTSTYSGVTDDQGVAAITFGIGRASIGYTVHVDVRFATGQTTTTSFTPR